MEILIVMLPLILNLIEQFCDKDANLSDAELGQVIRNPRGIPLRILARQQITERGERITRRGVSREMRELKAEAKDLSDDEVTELIQLYRNR